MKIVERLSFICIGLLLGVIGTFKHINPHFDFLEERAIHMSKMSFMLGCTLDKTKTLVDCQKEPGFTDNEEIFKNVEEVMNAESTNTEPAPKEEPPRAPFKEQGELSLVWNG